MKMKSRGRCSKWSVLTYSFSYRFLRRYGRVCRIKMDVLTLGRYILETSFKEYSLNINASESMLAAAALVLATKMKYFSELGPIETSLVKRPAKDNMKTVRSK